MERLQNVRVLQLHWKMKIVSANCLNIRKTKKGEPNWINEKSEAVIAECELKLIAHSGSGFDSWNIF